MTNQAPVKKQRFPWVGISILLLAILIPLFFYIISAAINRQSLPPQLQQPPQSFHAARANVIQEFTTATTSSFPIARAASGKDYESFLAEESRGLAKLDGVELYPKITAIKTLGGFFSAMQVVDGDRARDSWQPGKPLPPKLNQWLVDNADVVDLYLRFGESSGLPIRTVATISTAPDPSQVPIPNMSVVEGARVLAAEAQRRLELNDLPGAERRLRAAMRIVDNYGSEPINVMKSVTGRSILSVRKTFENLLNTDALTTSQLTAWRKIMADAHRDVFPQDWNGAMLPIEYPAMRKRLIEKLTNTPWRTHFFGYDVKQKFNYYHKTAWGMDWPRLDRMAETSLRAMRYKRDIARLITEHDQFFGAVMQLERQPWPEIVRMPPVSFPKDNPLFPKSSNENYYLAYLIDGLRFESELNLMRAAIEWKLAHAAPPAAITQESPWRDPYAEAPFQLTDGTTATLIYGLGPDLKDQNGLLSYDPTNGTRSPGDIILKIRR